MVFISEYDEFMRLTQEMFELDPVHSRYVIKYRNCDREGILKVTNNSKWYQYKLIGSDSMNKIDNFTVNMLSIASNFKFEKQVSGGGKGKKKNKKNKKKN